MLCLECDPLHLLPLLWKRQVFNQSERHDEEEIRFRGPTLLSTTFQQVLKETYRVAIADTKAPLVVPIRLQNSDHSQPGECKYPKNQDTRDLFVKPFAQVSLLRIEPPRRLDPCLFSSVTVLLDYDCALFTLGDLQSLQVRDSSCAIR